MCSKNTTSLITAKYTQISRTKLCETKNRIEIHMSETRLKTLRKVLYFFVFLFLFLLFDFTLNLK